MENSESGHEKAIDSSSSMQFQFEPFYPSNYPQKHTVFVDFLNDGYSLSPHGETKDALGSYFYHIHQQNLMDRYQSVHSQLCFVAKHAQDLYQENINLKMVNLELNNRLRVLLNSTFHGLEPGPGVDAMDAYNKTCLVSEDGISENEGSSTSTSNFVDSSLTRPTQRSHLPKSISVRSSGYQKSIRSYEGSMNREASVKASNKGKFNAEAQKVYVKGSKEQPLELEVYNQGMFKTELCNKWHLTGSCPYGNNCQFAHGIGELRPILRHPRYKTEVCRMVLNGIPCPYGHRCHFRHSLTDQENPSRAMSVNSSDQVSNYH